MRKTVMKIMAAKTMRKFSSRLIFVSRELGRKNWDLCNRANPASHLIWTHMFYKEKSAKVRSRKPSQPGWQDSFEVTLSASKNIRHYHLCFSTKYILIALHVPQISGVIDGLWLNFFNLLNLRQSLTFSKVLLYFLVFWNTLVNFRHPAEFSHENLCGVQCVADVVFESGGERSLSTQWL